MGGFFGSGKTTRAEWTTAAEAVDAASAATSATITPAARLTMRATYPHERTQPQDCRATVRSRTRARRLPALRPLRPVPRVSPWIQRVRYSRRGSRCWSFLHPWTRVPCRAAASSRPQRRAPRWVPMNACYVHVLTSTSGSEAWCVEEDPSARVKASSCSLSRAPCQRRHGRGRALAEARSAAWQATLRG